MTDNIYYVNLRIGMDQTIKSAQGKRGGGAAPGLLQYMYYGHISILSILKGG